MRTAAGPFLVLMWLHCELGVLGEEGVYYIFVGSVSRIVAFPRLLSSSLRNRYFLQGMWA